ncbi:urease accessory protein UreF [Elioraea tepida]|uniref:Urease accessory protein UreF n=1 Tax=Elioraea tepida TaxID=2843330 RepID=A0A975U4I2_9PROT|nr:urease accessory UreF family protein [Elioraea tepida]QXM25414.1 urease accessory protein UreF [Elioraea tepida]
MTAAPERMVESAPLWRLLLWCSPAFPVGSFSNSHGLEWSVEAGDVSDPASLTDWVDALLTAGAGWTDSVFLAHAHRAAVAADRASLSDLAEQASAFAASHEREVEMLAQGAAFARALAAGWPALAAALPQGDRLPYAVAFGAACGAAGIPLRTALVAHLQAFAGMVVSAAVRLVPLGQSDALRVLAALEPLVHAVAEAAAAAPLNAVGGAAFRSDIAAMAHETQYTRLFRT